MYIYKYKYIYKYIHYYIIILLGKNIISRVNLWHLLTHTPPRFLNCHLSLLMKNAACMKVTKEQDFAVKEFWRASRRGAFWRWRVSRGCWADCLCGTNRPWRFHLPEGVSHLTHSRH